jgi:tetratricopeptide (TPR) repeat protein
MSRQGGRPPAADCNLLWAASGGTCAYPGCQRPLVVLDAGRWVTVGEIAHIHAHSSSGPRFDPSISGDEVDAYANCLLLCRDHHRIVDSNPNEYPADLLREWKRNHEVSVQSTLEGSLVGSLASPPPLAHNFVARPQLEERIAAALDQDSKVAITGVSGSGKTQLAAHFLEHSVNEYTFRWWVRATSREILENDLAAVGAFIGIRGVPNEPIESVARRVIIELETRSGWLLVVDDVADLNSVSDLLPRTSNGHVIVTTQNAGWYGYGQALAIPPLSRAEGRELLRSAPLAQSSTDDVLDEISSLFSGLPLAIAQAASYLAATGSSIEQYKTLLVQRRSELLSRGHAGQHPTLDASINVALSKLSDNARQLLEMLSVLGPGSFSLEPTEDDIGNILSDPLAIEDALAELRSLSLVERDGNIVVTHELVQDLVRSQTAGVRSTLALYRAFTCVARQLPERTDLATSWPVVERLLPHALLLVEHLETAPTIPARAAVFLLNRIAPYLQSRGQEARAEQLFHQALRLLDTETEEDIRDLRGSVLNNLGNLLYERGELPQAEAMLRQALDLKDTAAIRDDRTIGIACASLAVVVEARGDLAEAKTLHERALVYYRQAGDVPRTTDCLIDLARLTAKQNGDPEAIELLQEAINVSDGHEEAWAEAANAHTILAGVYRVAGDLPQAAHVARKARTIAQGAVPESVELARAMASHGKVLVAMGTCSYGISLLEKALSMYVHLESDRTTEAAIIKGDLGWGLLVCGEPGTAYPLLKASEEQISNLLPADHESVRNARGLLADCLIALGRPDEARTLLE